MVQMGVVTIVGYAGSDPMEFGKTKGAACSFRLGCTRGYYDANHIWHSFPTTWITVKAFRRLAENVRRSIRKGDPVLVTGQLNTELWKVEDGSERSRIVVEASSIGHDLNGGSTLFQKPAKPQAADGEPSTDDGRFSIRTTGIEQFDSRDGIRATVNIAPESANYSGEYSDSQQSQLSVPGAGQITEVDMKRVGDSADDEESEFADPQF